MPSTLLEKASQRLPSWYERSPSDVFALVKAFVSDCELSQAPLLVMPGCKVDDMMNAYAKLSKPTAPCSSSVPLSIIIIIMRSGLSRGLDPGVSDERAEVLQELAEYLQENYLQYGRGAQYLLQLSGKIAMKRSLPNKLEWILKGPAPGSQRGHASLQDPAPHVIRQLRVKFHRYY